MESAPVLGFSRISVIRRAHGQIRMLFEKLRAQTWLLAILILGGVLRFWDLTTAPPGVWYDEIFPFDRVFDILQSAGPYYPTYLPATNVLSQLLFGQYLSIILLGPGTLAIRLPGAIYGTVLIAAVYWLTLELFDRRTALWAAFFTAICPLAIQSSRVFYMQQSLDAVFFLTVGCALFVAELRRSEPRYSRLLLAYVLIALVASLTFTNYGRITAVCLLITLIIYGLTSKRGVWSRRDLQNMILYPATAVGVIVFLFPILAAPGSSISSSGISTYSSSQNLLLTGGLEGVRTFSVRFLQYFSPSFLMFGGDPNPSQNLSGVGELLTPVGVLFYAGCVILAWNVISRPKARFASLFVGIWLLTTPIEIAAFAPADYPDSGGVIFMSGVAPIVAALAFSWVLGQLMRLSSRRSRSASEDTRSVSWSLNSKASTYSVAASVVVVSLIFAGQFSYSYFVTQSQSVINDPDSQWGMMYGFPQVAQFIYDNGMTELPVYISPLGLFGNSSSAFNYWFYATQTPANFLDYYSHGLIRNVSVATTPVQYHPYDSLVLSGSSSLILSYRQAGIGTRPLYEVLRPDGSVAIDLFEAYSNLSASEMSQLSSDQVFASSEVSEFTSLNSSAVLSIRDNFTASVRFQVPAEELPTHYQINLMGTWTPSFAVSLWGSGYYPQFGTESGLVPVADVYSNVGNWSLPGSWDRLAGPGVLAANETYMETLTCENGQLSLFVNSTPSAAGELAYPVWPFNDTILLDQYGNFTILDAHIWNIGLTAGQIGYLYYSRQ
jgi:hypothetical protein